MGVANVECDSESEFSMEKLSNTHKISDNLSLDSRLYYWNTDRTVTDIVSATGVKEIISSAPESEAGASLILKKARSADSPIQWPA